MQKRKLIASLLIVAQFVTATPAVKADSDSDLPDIGDPTGTLLTPEQEKQMGAAFFRGLHRQLEISDDPEVSDYIQSVGQKLVEVSDGSAQAFHFFVVNSPDINAFAGPGGYIGVNSGLIMVSEAESELASVLGHEIAHVTQKHLYQTFQAASRLTLPVMAAVLAGALLGAKSGSGQVAQAAILSAQAAATQYQINFTRDNEAEADRIGMQTLSRSGFDPRAMPTFFERMQQSTRFAGRQLPEFLLTHPVTVSRISDTRGRAERFAYKQVLDSTAYQLIRAKLRVLTATNANSALNYFGAIARQGTKFQQDVTAYGMALAQTKASRPEMAIPELKRLVAAYPEQVHFINALAEAEQARKNFSQAAQLYSGALLKFPRNRALTLNYVRVLLALGKAGQAQQLLRDFTRIEVSNPDVYELLAECESRLGNEAESHRYMAEAYYAAGQTRDAILQLRIARNASGDNFYVSAVVDERLKQFEEELLEQRRNR